MSKIGKDHIPECVAKIEATGFYLGSPECPGYRRVQHYRVIEGI
jgi:hypothetical protein